MLNPAVRWQSGKGANRALFFGAGNGARRNRRKTEAVVFSGLFFFGDFLLEKQKKVTSKIKEQTPPERHTP